MIKTTSLTALVLAALMAAGAAQATEKAHKAVAAASATAVLSASKPAAATHEHKATEVKVETTAAGGAGSHGDDKSIPTTPKIGPRGTEGKINANVKAKAEVKAGAQH